MRELALALPVPVLPDLRVAVRHLETSRHGRTGSFATVVVLPDGRVGAASGEVASTDAMSAAVLRLTAVFEERLRAGADITEAASALDRLAEGRPSEGTTLCLVVLDPTSGAFTYLTAAHPGPLVVGGSTVARLPATTGLPLGDPAPRRVVAGRLHGTELLVLVGGDRDRTTGPADEVTPHVASDRPGTEGPDRPGDPAESVCAALLELFAQDPAATDTSVLAVQRRPRLPDLDVELPAGAGTPWAGQELFDRWLGEANPDPVDHEALDEALVELLANAVEHGSSASGGDTVRLRSRLDRQGVVGVEVLDRGRWSPDEAWLRPAPPSSDGGLGLALVRQLVDDLRVAPGQDGTSVRVRRQLRRTPVVLTLPGAAGAAEGPEQLSVVTEPGVPPTVVASGQLTASTTGTLRTSLDIASRGGTAPVVLDLDRVTRVSASGIRLVRQLERSLLAHGGTLALRADAHGPAGRALGGPVDGPSDGDGTGPDGPGDGSSG